MNTSQDIKMQMVDDNFGNQVRHNAMHNDRNEVGQNAVQNLGIQIVKNMNGLSVVSKIANQYGNGNVVTAPAEGNGNGINGNPIRCYNCRGEGHYASNCTVKLRKHDAAYLQQQLQIAQEEEAGIQSTQEEFEFMDTVDAYEGTERVKVNCTLEDILQQASTSGTLSDNAPVYYSDGSAESKFVTDVKLVKDLHTSNYDQLHAYLEQHELHANEVRLMRKRNQDPLAFVANQQMTPPHFNTYQSSYNNPQLLQQFSPSQQGLIQPHQHYSSHYPSPTQFNHLSIPPSHSFQSHMNHQTSTVPQVIPQVSYQSPQAPTQLMTESPFVDSGFVVPTEDLDTYDSDCDDISNAQAVLMANISNYGSDVISERSESCEKGLNLDAEFSKSKQEYNDLLNKYSQPEKHYISLKVSMQLKQEVFQKDESCVCQYAPEILEYFEKNDLQAQLKDKDKSICKLKDTIKSLRKNNKEEIVDHDICDLATINAELENSVTKLLSENERLCKEINHVKQVFKDQFDSIKQTRVLQKEQCCLCAICGKCVIAETHYACVHLIVTKMNESKKSKSAKKHKKQNVWKPTGHVFTEVRLKWKPTGKTFTIVSNSCPLTRFTVRNNWSSKVTKARSTYCCCLKLLLVKKKEEDSTK
nr:hypothetical protein [Tanacetum cinerariifolium]